MVLGRRGRKFSFRQMHRGPTEIGNKQANRHLRVHWDRFQPVTYFGFLHPNRPFMPSNHAISCNEQQKWQDNKVSGQIWVSSGCVRSERSTKDVAVPRESRG